jgi:transketolase
MAAIGVSLWKYVMRYAPHTPTYFNRDRFVLSNGKIICFIVCCTDSANLTQAILACSNTRSFTLQATRQ